MSTSNLPRGIDISNHQGVIDWDRVKDSGIVFGFAKATEGHYFNDAYFSRNWREMARVGIQRGAYHFARPSTGLPEQEAAFFLASVNNAGGLETADMLVLDMEDERYHDGGAYGSAGAWSIGFCEYIEEATGIIPVIYTGPWYVDSRGMRDHDALAEFPLWLAAYQQRIPAPPAPWEAVSFWQFTSSGMIPGVAGDCDVNVFNGTPDRLPLLGKLPDEVVPEPEEPTYVVGPGILERMDEYHDIPATNEHYLTPDWSEAYAKSGAKYVYIASLNRVERFSPDD